MIELERTLIFRERFARPPDWRDTTASLTLPVDQFTRERVELDSGLRFLVVGREDGISVYSGFAEMIRGSWRTFDHWADLDRFLPPRWSPAITLGWSGRFSISAVVRFIGH